MSPADWGTLAVLLCATFVQLVDINIVNIAIPSIQSQLNTNFASAELIIAGYQMTFAAFLMLAAKLGDRFGPKQIFLIGMFGFTISSLGCAMSENQVELVGFRLIQGAASATMFPQVLTHIQLEFPPSLRSKLLAIYGAVAGVAYLVGPATSGILLHLNPFGLGWRSIFLVNLPIGIVALVGGVLLLRRTVPPARVDVDYLGAALFGLFTAALVFPLAYGRESGWPLWLVLILIGSPIPLIAFILRERYRSSRGLEVLLPGELISTAVFRRGIFLTVIFFMAISPFLFAFTLYLQLGQNLSPLYAGLTTLPYAAGAAVLSAFSYRISRRLGKFALLLGSSILTAAMVLLFVLFQIRGTSVDGFVVAPALVLAGAGFGIFEPSVNTVVLSGVSRRGAGVASGALLSVQQLAGALGIGILGLIYFSLLAASAQYATNYVAPTIRRQLVPFSTTAPQNGNLIRQFSSCVVARATERDPTVNPVACADLGNYVQSLSIPELQKPIILGFLLKDAQVAESVDFTRSIKYGTIYEMTLFLAAGLASLLLPRRGTGLTSEDQSSHTAPAS